MIAFSCNICGSRSIVPRAKLDRETPTCASCASSVRYRSVVHVLSTELFGESLALPDFPERKDLRGVGLSDWLPYAGALAERLDYRNTYYHEEPRLDITDVPPELHGTLDFLVCSDVLEHVAPPVAPAFAACRSLLKPGGLLVLTVPYGPDGETIEHFPELHEYAVVEIRGRPVLLNRTREGEWQVHERLVFHGGTGETLEMRWFSRPSLERELAAAGFVDVREQRDEAPAFGVVYAVPWSVPYVARRG